VSDRLFAKILSTLLTKHEISVRKAAKIADISVSTLQDWRSGTSPTNFKAVKRLADHFGVTLDYLLTGEVNHNPMPTVVRGNLEIIIKRLDP
jgi:transcriptional regulator with XRE-family HTH domain